MTTDGVMILDIENEKGLHARASARFVETVESYDAAATVSRAGMVVSGDSIMGLLMLAAAKGSTIDVSTSGAADAAQLMEAITALINDKFGEGK